MTGGPQRSTLQREEPSKDPSLALRPQPRSVFPTPSSFLTPASPSVSLTPRLRSLFPDLPRFPPVPPAFPLRRRPALCRLLALPRPLAPSCPSALPLSRTSSLEVVRVRRRLFPRASPGPGRVRPPQPSAALGSARPGPFWRAPVWPSPSTLRHDAGEGQCSPVNGGASTLRGHYAPSVKSRREGLEPWADWA